MPKYLVHLRTRETRCAIIEADSEEQIEEADIPDDVFHRDVFYEGGIEVMGQVGDDVSADFNVREIVWKVERRFASGWADAGWTDASYPRRFATEEAADSAIADFLFDSQSGPQSAWVGVRDDYRAVRAYDEGQDG